MRVFVPVTHAGVRSLLGSGGLGPPPILGFGVTGALREWYAEGDDEELEYAAMTLAAQACVGLLATLQVDKDQPSRVLHRRMVLVVDTNDAWPDAEDTVGGVLIDTAVAMREVVALHADTEEAASDVAAAVAVVRDGGPHDQDEQFVVDTCQAHELAWFATQEIPDLL